MTNYSDIFLRQSLYPGFAFGSILGADGVGTVVSAPSSRDLVGKRVVLTPARGWKSDPRGPEKAYGIMGGVKFPTYGTFAEYILVEEDELALAPSHLSNIEAAAIPLAGLTAYRAVFTKAGIKKDDNVLITGIGGGVALFCLQFAVGVGANVYVTSGDKEKIDKAKKLGAKDGVNYKDQDWSKQLKSMLNGQSLDAVIDSAGGDIVLAVQSLLRTGGIIAAYGQTVAPKISFPMSAVLKNIEYRASTMGSNKEFAEMVKLIDEKKIKPLVSHVVNGLDKAEEGWSYLKDGKQFGKVVIQISNENSQL